MFLHSFSRALIFGALLAFITNTPVQCTAPRLLEEADELALAETAGHPDSLRATDSVNQHVTSDASTRNPEKHLNGLPNLLRTGNTMIYGQEYSIVAPRVFNLDPQLQQRLMEDFAVPQKEKDSKLPLRSVIQDTLEWLVENNSNHPLAQRVTSGKETMKSIIDSMLKDFNNFSVDEVIQLLGDKLPNKHYKDSLKAFLLEKGGIDGINSSGDLVKVEKIQELYAEWMKISSHTLTETDNRMV
ncbi:hypothetical protein PGTUg99_010418 [Puccinia graminis f. sp. tritici]|nr:hypothetical protein PGTUg99_010418 [Puccinia graminis f. sp. tritici]